MWYNAATYVNKHARHLFRVNNYCMPVLIYHLSPWDPEISGID